MVGVVLGHRGQDASTATVGDLRVERRSGKKVDDGWSSETAVRECSAGGKG